MSTLSKLIVIALGGVLLGVAGFGFWQWLGNQPDEQALAAPVGETTIPTLAITTSTFSTTTTTTPTTTTTTLPPKETLVIQGTGDVNLDPSYIPTLAANGWDNAWSGLEGLFLEDDLTVINLECAPSHLGSPEPKAFVFRCPPESLPSLVANGVEVANLGNNHSGDYGKEALVDGRAQLISSGVAAVGAGKDLAEAGEPALFEIDGWKVAVVGLGGVSPGDHWYAAEDRAGMRSGDHIDQMVEAVSAADEVADVVVVSIHWGVELDTTPRAEDVERARAMIAAGADAIFGHHSHRMQPYETVDGAAVFWSLGNFVWPSFSVAGSTTGVARVVVSPDGSIDACLIPAYIESHGHPVLSGAPGCGPGP
ncbi:MAG: CapA family protein [Actinobacteria bacterium]|nr:CapA family protein [Actinomycetota bacterium]